MSTIVYLVGILAATLVLTPLAIVITKKKMNYNLQSRRVSLRSVFIDANNFQEAKNVAERFHPGWRAIRARRAEFGKSWEVKIKLINKRKGYQ